MGRVEEDVCSVVVMMLLQFCKRTALGVAEMVFVEMKSFKGSSMIVVMILIRISRLNLS
jgi:hypothetical protein